MKLRSIMTPVVETVDAEAPVEHAWRRMAALDIHHLVVVRGREVVGVVSERDLAPHIDDERPNVPEVGDVMNEVIVTAGPDDTVAGAADLMRGEAIGCLPIIENGTLAGIVTLSDMLRRLSTVREPS